ncbi:pentapeptide repeat-containing protein [Amycolatopsis jejuensis]|uniref:pentapeptide repeat-containing protein n=1 Tax=Amycolatopsis jejuensis TaxID=330084 RepID=UPI0006912AFE|nr:pentapeptide repeat-containing protein [Amycolatopsis jejuensis]
MGGPSATPDDETGRILSGRTILICTVTMAAVAAAACWFLFTRYGNGTEADRVRLDGIRTVGTIVVGTGGALALLLAARRQQTAERDLATKRADLRLREQANTDARHDATERRINELYLKAVEQLGADPAPVRLAGLYALDRLAQDNSRLRPTITNVLSAYLRMPYDLATSGVGPEPRQEREVRLTAQRLLVQHLTPGARPEQFWEDVELDLSGAVLFDFSLNGSTLHNASFTGAHFVGEAWFHEATFTGATRFDETTFDSAAWFVGATFTGSTQFENAVFCDDARFEDAEFVGTTLFRQAKFCQNAYFIRTLLQGLVRFSAAEFDRDARFVDARLMTDATSEDESAAHRDYTDRVRFDGEAWFDRVHLSSYTTFAGAEFDSAVTFTGTTLDGAPYRPPQLQSDHLGLDDAS